jgi:gamma-glutamyl:cysteine ligase YbdK (ATP-grasp superfamily)
MGQEITDSRFSDEAFVEFRHRLDRETALLGQWLQEGRLASSTRRFGFEIEAWLIDRDARPAPRNADFLAELDDPLVVPELARFNFEINSDPAVFADHALSTMHEVLTRRWQACQSAAARLGLRALLIGILPTVDSRDLTLAAMSPMKRYQAINDQIFRLRQGRPILLDIEGEEHLHHAHPDVMLEAGTTSLQIHVQVDADEAAKAFNICKMLSAATVGLAANSPFLFQRRLWQETRIPLFEQAVAVGGSDYSKRVTFGVRYAQRSILECFEANRLRYPVLLPDVMGESPQQLAHLRLHNGTIWRWNRPLIGFGDDGSPHIRIEHRVIPAGPTPRDSIANMALFLGLFEALMRDQRTLAECLPFEQARDSFYAAARHGLDADVAWLDGRRGPLRELGRDVLLPLAHAGLVAAGLAPAEAEHWLAPVRGRIDRHCTGADWQAGWIARHGRDFAGLVDAYAEQQAADRPVHLW